MLERIIQATVFGGEEERTIEYTSSRRWNLTNIIDGATSRNRIGEWMILENGRVTISVSGKGSGGQLLQGATIYQVIDSDPKSEITLESKSGKRHVGRDIPENGSVVVVKKPQRFEFSYFEK